jgi:hypothetical protein
MKTIKNHYAQKNTESIDSEIVGDPRLRKPLVLVNFTLF